MMELCAVHTGELVNFLRRSFVRQFAHTMSSELVR